MNNIPTVEAAPVAEKPAAKKSPATRKSTAKRSAVAKKVVRKSAKIKQAKKPASKPAVKAKPAKQAMQKAAKPKAAKPDKLKKPKLVRDSFTMPEQEYAVLGQVKKTCHAGGITIKKSELLRIGVAQLASMDLKKLKAAQAALTPLKAGRPKKSK